jgi:hypothetical protein
MEILLKYLLVILSEFAVFALNYAISASDNLAFPGYDFYIAPPVIPLHWGGIPILHVEMQLWRKTMPIISQL